MTMSSDQLEHLGLEVAREVAGAKVQEVDVRPGVDWTERPAYFFAFRFDDDEDRRRASQARSRISQRIRDALIHSGDEGYPFIRFLGTQDWSKRHHGAW